jgi:hypothetical protein
MRKGKSVQKPPPAARRPPAPAASRQSPPPPAPAPPSAAGRAPRAAENRPRISDLRFPPPDEPEILDAEPSEDDFTVKPNEWRRKLTEDDLARNRRVADFFNRVKPGIPIDADAPELRREPVAFPSLIEKLLKKLNISESPWMDDLNRAWPTLVAPDVARIARPGKFADGILFIFVTSNMKLFELRRSGLRDIERAVRDFPGGDRVRQVRLMVNAVMLPSAGERGR